MKKEIKEAIEFLSEQGFNITIPAEEGYYSLAEAVSDVLEETGIHHEYNEDFKKLVEEVRKQVNA